MVVNVDVDVVAVVDVDVVASVQAKLTRNSGVGQVNTCRWCRLSKHNGGVGQVNT